MAVVEENSKLVGDAAAEQLGKGCHLLIHDAVVLLLRASLEIFGPARARHSAGNT
jgi:hypothetical protein